jgi:hypothetical protein
VLTGIRPTPHAATVRRLLQRVDDDALDTAIGAYLKARTPSSQLSEPPPKPSLRAIAVDGKTDIAAALRHTSRDCHRPLSALGLT